MAFTLLAGATGNFTTAGTWGKCDSTSELDSENSSTAVSNSNLDSSTFTPGAITVDGVALKLAGRSASPSGTFTVTLRNSTDSADVVSVVTNVSALDSNGSGWHFFQFSASQTLTAGKAYLIRVVCSVAGSQVTLYRDSTSNNWSRQLRTTTTQAPASGDKLIMCGTFDGSANPVTAVTAATITHNDTSGTSYGAAATSTYTSSISINKGCTFTQQNTASTNYTLKFRGLCVVFGGGTWNIGSSGTPLDSTSTLLVTFDVASNTDTGIDIKNGGTIGWYGATKTVKTTLAADYASGTSLTTTDSLSGWGADNIAVAATTRTVADSEFKLITSASGTTITLPSGLAHAHSGTAPTKAEVINLTRNVQFYGTSNTLQGYLVARSAATVVIKYCEHKFLGQNTTDKHGWEIQTTASGSFTADSCSIWANTSGGNGFGFYCTGSAVDAFTVTNCVFFLINAQCVYVNSTSGTNWTITGCVSILNNTQWMYSFDDLGGTVTNNTAVSAAGGGNGFGFLFNGDSGGINAAVGTFSGNVAHTCNTAGFAFSNGNATFLPVGFTLTNSKAWRCLNYGLQFLGTTWYAGVIIDTFDAFGNTQANVRLDQGAYVINAKGYNWTLSGDTTFSTPAGIQLGNQCILQMRIETMSCGVSSGIRNGHTTADVQGGNPCVIEIVGSDIKFASSTALSSWDSTHIMYGGKIGSADYGQATGTHKQFDWTNGTITSDTTIYHNASPSERLTPASASYKIETGPTRFAVDSGATPTFAVYVRKSVIGDGAAYNGAQPRLMLRRNDAVGITSDTVLATATNSANGAWLQISGTASAATDDGVMEIYVDCDGTAGWVNVDDWSIA